MRYVFLCDFDGTVAPFDIGAEFVRHFGRGPTDALERGLARWQAGEIGHRELTRIECQRLEVTEAAAHAFTRRYRLDPAFPGFVSEVAQAGDRIEVVSEGFDFYIRDLLAQAGLGGVAFSSNRLRFEPDARATPEFPHAGGCGRCGNCKGARVVEHRRQGCRVVMIGDGYSDRCGARGADHVLARGTLLDWCRGEGLPVEPFEDFAGVAAWARERWAGGTRGALGATG